MLQNHRGGAHKCTNLVLYRFVPLKLNIRQTLAAVIAQMATLYPARLPNRAGDTLKLANVALYRFVPIVKSGACKSGAYKSGAIKILGLQIWRGALKLRKFWLHTTIVPCLSSMSQKNDRTGAAYCCATSNVTLSITSCMDDNLPQTLVLGLKASAFA